MVKNERWRGILPRTFTPASVLAKHRVMAGYPYPVLHVHILVGKHNVGKGHARRGGGVVDPKRIAWLILHVLQLQFRLQCFVSHQL